MIRTQTHGLRETQAALDDVGPTLERESKEADKREASRLAPEIRAAAYSIGSTAAHVAPSIRAEGTSVALGGGAYPMAGGAEFGSGTFRQFDAFTTRGYFFAPTMREAERRDATEHGKALDDTLRKTRLT